MSSSPRDKPSVPARPPRGASKPRVSDVQRDVVPTFVNELIAGGAPVVLVLDDYHAVSAGPVHASLGALLEHCPPQLHLVVLTRATPTLPLSR